MYCKHCGSSIDDGAKFCQHCGGEQYIADEPKVIEEPAVEAEADEEKKSAMAAYVFKWGLMGAIFSHTLILSFLGIIFSSKAKKAANDYKRQFGNLKGKILAGHILSIAGLVLGIIYTVFVAFYIFVLFVSLFAVIYASISQDVFQELALSIHF